MQVVNENRKFRMWVGYCPAMTGETLWRRWRSSSGSSWARPDYMVHAVRTCLAECCGSRDVSLTLSSVKQCEAIQVGSMCSHGRGENEQPGKEVPASVVRINKGEVQNSKMDFFV